MGLFARLTGSLDAAALRAEATRRTGLRDWGGDDFVPALHRVLDSVDEDVQPHLLGRRLIRELLVQTLCNRLQFVAACAANPAAFDEAPRDPLIIASMPRTGTTLLHRMLCQDPDALWLPLWLLLAPMPPPTDEEWAAGGARLRQAKVSTTALRWLVPGLEVKHESRAHQPEECTWLFMGSFVSLQFWALWPVVSYGRWVADVDPRPAYRFYRRHLQLLQATRPDGRWVLKSPMHFLGFEALVDVFPEARIVQLHRDPAVVVPSLHSLFASTHRVVTHRRDEAACIALSTEIMAERAARIVEIREREDPARFFDVQYVDLVRDPLGTAERLYDGLGHAWTPELAARLSAWVAENPVKGRHRYSLEQFGQTREQIEEAFAPYIERFQPIRES